jgi:hypothetical protein
MLAHSPFGSPLPRYSVSLLLDGHFSHFTLMITGASEAAGKALQRRPLFAQAFELVVNGITKEISGSLVSAVVLPIFFIRLRENAPPTVPPNPAVSAAIEPMRTYPELRAAISYMIALIPHAGIVDAHSRFLLRCSPDPGYQTFG